MSVLGQGPSAPSGNIFGHLGASSSAAAAAAASQPAQQTPSVFGNLGNNLNNNTSQPTQTSSIFGNLNPVNVDPQTQTPSLFANLGAQSNPPASSIFSQPPPPAPATGPVFGASNAGAGPAAPLPSSVFGSTLAQAGSVFGSTQNAQSVQNPGQGHQGQLGQSMQANAAESTVQTAYFNSLLEKNKQRARDQQGPGFNDVPTLQLGLGAISKRIKEIGGHPGVQTRGDRAADSKAHYLLAASGVNPGTTLRDLDSFGAQSPSATLNQPASDWDPDSHKYVEQLEQRTTAKMVAESFERSQRNFNAFLEEQVDMDWDAQRKKVYAHFNLTPRLPDDSTGSTGPGARGGFGRSSRRSRLGNAGQSNQETPNRSIFGQSALQRSVIGSPGARGGGSIPFGQSVDTNSAASSGQDDRFARDKQIRYAQKVQSLNEARLQDISYPILGEFLSVEASSAGETPAQVLDAYRALAEIVQEDNESRGLKPRQFAKDYLDETPHSTSSMNMRRRITDGSRKALEKQFFKHLQNLVARNPRDASIGGVPSVVNRVRAYIRIRDARKDLAPDGVQLQTLNDDYCWALIFFLIRSGHGKEALKYVMDNSTPFRSLDRNFVTYIDAYYKNDEGRLPRGQQEKINSEYLQKSRMAQENSMDPYRLACYKIIGRCELSKRSIDTISQGVEDWIWLQFSLAREANRAEEVATEVYGLDDVRETIREIGQRHFSKGSEASGGFGTFLYMQILGGMFENAVNYLYRHSYVTAIHFAVALDYYGLLRVSGFGVSENDLLTYTTREQPQIDFARMVGFYTRDFRAANVVAATDYITLICLNADLPGALGKSQAELCHEGLRELVLETREFAQLLGDIRGDGTRIKGAIEQRLRLIHLPDQDAFLRNITIQAARVADESGRTIDAVLLYHLAEDYDNVIEIINRTLSEALAMDLGQERMRLQPLKAGGADGRGNVQEQASLCLSAVDDPAELARSMIHLYDGNGMYMQKIRPINRSTCGLLVRIAWAREAVESGQWLDAIERLNDLALLPLNAAGSIATIRSAVQNMKASPNEIVRLVGPLLLWAMTSLGHHWRSLLHDAQHGGFDNDTRRAARDQCVRNATDLMVFAGMTKLRVGREVWDALTTGAMEMGVQ